MPSIRGTLTHPHSLWFSLHTPKRKHLIGFFKSFSIGFHSLWICNWINLSVTESGTRKQPLHFLWIFPSLFISLCYFSPLSLSLSPLLVMKLNGNVKHILDITLSRNGNHVGKNRFCHNFRTKIFFQLIYNDIWIVIFRSSSIPSLPFSILFFHSSSFFVHLLCEWITTENLHGENVCVTKIMRTICITKKIHTKIWAKIHTKCG